MSKKESKRPEGKKSGNKKGSSGYVEGQKGEQGDPWLWSNASNYKNVLGGEVSPRTGELTLSLKVPSAYGFLSENITPSIRYSQSELASADRMLGLPLGWRFGYSFVYQGRIYINGDQSFALDSSYDSGMRYYTMENAIYKDTSMDFPYDKKRKCSGQLCFQNGGSQYFDTNGRLLGIDDRFGNHVIFHYTVEDDVFSSKISKIEDAMGQEITFDHKKDSIAITYPKSKHNKVSFSYLIDGSTSQLIGYRDPLGQEISIVNKGGLRGDLVSEIAYYNGLKILYDYGTIKYSTDGSYGTLDVVTGTRECDGDLTRATAYDYDPLEDGHNYTGYPDFDPSGLKDTLLEEGSNYSYTCRIHNGTFMVEHRYNNLHLEVETCIYTLEKKLIKSIDKTYPGQDKDGYFPPYHELIQKFPNYQVPSEERTKVYNDSGAYRCYLNKNSFDGQGNLIFSERYQSNEDPDKVTLSTSVRMVYDYDDPKYKGKTPLYGLMTQKYEVDHSEDDPKVRGEVCALTKDQLSIESSTTGIADSIDAQGLSTTEKKRSYRYDQQGRITYQRVEWADGKEHDLKGTEIKISYKNSKGTMTIERTDANGGTSSQMIDTATGWVLAAKNELDHGMSYTYDDLGGLLSATDALGATLKWHYDYPKNKWTKEYANGYKFHQYKDPYGRIIKETDGGGTFSSERVLYEAVYDEKGQLTYEQGVLGTKSRLSYQYNDRGERTSTTDALGNVEEISRDAVLQTSEVKFNGHVVERTRYNDHHLGVHKEIPNKDTATGNPEVSFTYNAYGRNTSVTVGDPLSKDAHWSKVRTQYDLEFNPVVRTLTCHDGTTVEGQAQRDLFNNAVLQKIKRTQSDGKSMEAVGDLFSYNELNQLVKETNPLDQVRKYTYDPTGRMEGLTDYSGTLFNYTYLDNGLLASESYKDKDGKLQERKFGYDTATTRLTSIESLIDGKGQGTMAYSYTKDGLLERVTYPDGKKVSYTYDKYSRLSKLSDAFGKVTKYGYDAYGRISSLELDGAYKVEVAYLTKKNSALNSGMIKSITNSNGVQIEYAYTDLGAVSMEKTIDKSLAVNRNVLLCCEYTYDPTTQQITRLVRSSTASPKDTETNLSTEYTYNGLGQLVREKVSDGKGVLISDTSHLHDAAGNILETSVVMGNDPAIVTRYGYDADNKLLEVTGPSQSVTFEYDTNGNRVSDSRGNTYGYDPYNRLITFSDNTGVSATYEYYPNGLRRAKTVQGQGTTVFYYDESSRNAQILNESLEKDHSSFLMLGAKRFVRVLYDVYEKADPQYFVNNYKDTLALYKEHSLSEVYLYDAYGKNTPLPGKTTEGPGKKEAEGLVPNPFRYNMEYMDAESGLLYLRARYYSPETKCFMSRDTAMLFNRYSFCEGNPVMFTDPSGHGVFVGLGITAIFSNPVTIAVMAVTAAVVTAAVIISTRPSSGAPNNRGSSNNGDSARGLAANALQRARRDPRFSGVDPGVLYLGGGTSPQRKALFNAYPELAAFGYMRAAAPSSNGDIEENNNGDDSDDGRLDTENPLQNDGGANPTGNANQQNAASTTPFGPHLGFSAPLPQLGQNQPGQNQPAAPIAANLNVNIGQQPVQGPVPGPIQGPAQGPVPGPIQGPGQPVGAGRNIGERILEGLYNLVLIIGFTMIAGAVGLVIYILIFR
nr:RHS repeat-associated core domain-containing protein [uncultured Allomuricauda sp.]